MRRAPESGEAAPHTVVLSKQQLRIAREAVELARQDRENERRAGRTPGAGAARPGEPESPGLESREPEGTEAEARQPETAQAQAREPETTAEQAHQPGTTVPEATVPEATVPEATVPEATVPAAAAAVTAPGNTAPGNTAPGNPAPGTTAPGTAGAGPAARPPARPAPPWGTVLATTIRLWVQRHLGRLWPASPRWRVLTILIVAAVLFCGGAITVALARGAGGSGARRGAAAGSGAAGAALSDAAAARSAAAAWVAQQVSADAIIACDPQMCAVLQQHGIPAGRLLVLRAASPAPLGSDVIVSTAAVRGELGARLAGVYAPVALASFGSGSAQDVIRVVAPDGSAAYLRQLRSDVAGRVSAGKQLLGNPHVRVSGPARRALATGQVDSRLLSAFAALAHMYPVDVITLGPAAAGAGPGMPLRSADITPGRRAARHRASTLAALESFLRAQQVPYRPADLTTVRLPGGRTVLRVSYGAPEPLGLLGKG